MSSMKQFDFNESDKLDGIFEIWESSGNVGARESMSREITNLVAIRATVFLEY